MNSNHYKNRTVCTILGIAAVALLLGFVPAERLFAQLPSEEGENPAAATPVTNQPAEKQSGETQQNAQTPDEKAADALQRQLQRELGDSSLHDDNSLLSEISREMTEVKNRLKNADASVQTREQQKKIVDDLEKLLQQKKSGGGGRKEQFVIGRIEQIRRRQLEKTLPR